MRKYVLRRIPQLVPLIVFVLMLNFILIQLAPGTPLDYLVGRGEVVSQEYINRFMSELVPLFGLSGVETDIEITQKETIKELENNLKTELSRLKKIYESGDFLAKDEDKIKNKMGDITSYLQEWDVVVDEWILAGKEDLINKSKDLYKKGFASL